MTCGSATSRAANSSRCASPTVSGTPMQCMRNKGQGGLAGIVAVDDLLELFAEELVLLSKLVVREQARELKTRPCRHAPWTANVSGTCGEVEHVIPNHER